MATPRPDKKGNGLAACVAAVVILLPLLYLASLGPAVKMRDHGVISQDALVLAYAPLVWAADKYKPIENLIEWYCALWRT